MIVLIGILSFTRCSANTKSRIAREKSPLYLKIVALVFKNIAELGNISIASVINKRAPFISSLYVFKAYYRFYIAISIRLSSISLEGSPIDNYYLSTIIYVSVAPISSRSGKSERSSLLDIFDVGWIWRKRVNISSLQVIKMRILRLNTILWIYWEFCQKLGNSSFLEIKIHILIIRHINILIKRYKCI